MSAILLIGLSLAPLFVALSEPLLTITVLSSRPEVVSGGDALVRVETASDIPWLAELNGTDVTDQFRSGTNTTALLGYLSNLKAGENALVIRSGEKILAELRLTNHPAVGPIFAGPQQSPFICQTEANGLGPALDANCSADTIVEYYYRTSDPPDRRQLKVPTIGDTTAKKFSPGFKSYDPANPPPSNAIASTRTSDGKTVPYIVRREIGTINRAIYDIQFLHQPKTPLPTPWSNASSWNGRLVYHLGGGCNAGYHQGVLDPVGREQEPFVAQGYAVATSTLNYFAVTCNDRVSAETLSMVKEHFIETYGAPAYTIGEGGSGGAMQAHLIAENYPGLLDGIIAKMSYPDALSTAQSVADCRLLERAFKHTGSPWSEEQRSAVSGFATWRTCTEGWGLKFIDARDCDPAVPQHLIYDASLNPRGVRCDIFSNAISAFGQSSQSGIALRPLDNVGVQYGLAALNNGKISFGQFIALNQIVGGFDQDGNIVATRTQASMEALQNAYSRGILLTGGGGLSQVPIIDWRPYLDDLADGHDRFRSFQTRARLIAATGRSDNQAMIVAPRLNTLLDYINGWSVVIEQDRSLVRSMDQWLSSIANDRRTISRADKIAVNTPADLADGCWTISGERIVERAHLSHSGRCNQLYPSHGDARTASGGPDTGSVLKCALKPVRSADYRIRLNAAQLDQLKSTFPSGVCDYSKPGIGQQLVGGTWQNFSGSTQSRFLNHE